MKLTNAELRFSKEKYKLFNAGKTLTKLQNGISYEIHRRKI